MFSSQKPKPKHDNANVPATSKTAVPSIISGDLNILGNLVCEGSIEIEGHIEGNVTCNLATIRRNGMVKGDVIADAVNVDGEICGLVKARAIRLSATAKVSGVIMYESLSIEDGAFIDGQCKSTEKMQQRNLTELQANAPASAETANAATPDLRLINSENEFQMAMNA